MRRELFIGAILAIMLAYIFLIGVPVIRLETEEKTIRMKAEDVPAENPRYGTAKILLPAIEEDGNGTMAWLKVEVNQGEGRILLEIDKISFLDNTQDSIRLGKLVAEGLVNLDTGNYDIIYSVDADVSKIEGPSAGPAIAIATAIALQNKTINDSVVISGYLREDGTIEKVSGLLVKAEAAKTNGVKLFLVPSGQSIQIKTSTEKTCDSEGLTTFCETKKTREKVSIQDEVGIDIVEVKTVSEALKYFIVD